MSIGLINWSKNGNLGDDAMTRILLEYFEDVENFSDDVNNLKDKDWYIFGGGTLITPSVFFFEMIQHPERTIGISLGVSSNWEGQHVDILKRMKKIYVRDVFSYNRLKEYGIESTLSVDLMCYLQPMQKKKKQGMIANIMYTWCSINKNHKEEVNQALKETMGIPKFAMCLKEDIETMKNAELYTDAQKLIDDLSGFKTIYATRLHANIAAWLSGCKDIRAIEYDPKIKHFFERVKDLTPEKAKETIDEHLKEIKHITTTI